MHKFDVIMKRYFFKRLVIAAIVVAALVCSCTPHKWFIVNSEGILSYDRNKGTFELLWTNKDRRLFARFRCGQSGFYPFLQSRSYKDYIIRFSAQDNNPRPQ